MRGEVGSALLGPIRVKGGLAQSPGIGLSGLSVGANGRVPRPASPPRPSPGAQERADLSPLSRGEGTTHCAAHSAAVVALGIEVADPLIGLGIALFILKITWDSWRTVRTAPVE